RDQVRVRDVPARELRRRAHVEDEEPGRLLVEREGLGGLDVAVVRAAQDDVALRRLPRRDGGEVRARHAEAAVELAAHLLDLAAPSPPRGPADLRIRVRATAVNRADLLQRQGFYPPPPGASPILGLECAGEVAEVGPEARGFRPGERVMALLAGGGYAEEAVVHYT